MHWIPFITTWDDRFLLWLNSFVGRWPVFDRFVGVLLNTSELQFGVIVAVYYWLWFRNEPPKQEQRATLVMTGLASFCALTATRLLILMLPFRARPVARPELHFLVPAGYDATERVWSSFPSDHAVMAFTISTGFWLVSRRVGVWAYLHSVIIICAPRVYFGLHHPSDIIGGALLGVAVALMATRMSLVRPIAVRILYVEQRYRGLFYLSFFLLLQQVVVMFSNLREVVGLALGALRGH